MSTADKLNKLLETKAAIKQAIIDKGVEVADDTVFADYPSKINSIPMEGGDPYYEDLYNMRTSNGTNMAGLFSYCTVPELDLSNLDVSNVTDMEYMFCSCESSINIDGWNTSKLTDVQYMFWFFDGSIDVSKLNTSSITKAAYMFYSAASTDNIILTGLSFPNTTNLDNMFSSAKGTVLDLSSWDISNITSMSNMFSSASYKKIDLTGWDTSNVTNMNGLFNSYANKLEELIIPDWDMTNVTKSASFMNTSNMSKLQLIDLSRSNDATITKITSFLPTRTADTSGTIKVPGDTSQEVCDALTAKYWIPEKPVSVYVPGEFAYSSATEIRTMVNESHTDLSYMFNWCGNLVSVNTQDWDTCNVTNTAMMFNYCQAIESVDLSNWDTSSLSNTMFMFESCTNLKSVDVSGWDTSNMTTMDGMFARCSSLITINGISNWDVSNAITIGGMFRECTSLESLDLSNWVINNPSIDSIFADCTSLHTLHLDNCSYDTISKIVNADGFPADNYGTIYCKEENAADFILPGNWTFSFVE